MPRSLAAFVAGRYTKYVVLVLWIGILAVAAPLSTQLFDAQKNDTESWLPGNAESTKLLNRMAAASVDDQTVATIIVYERSSGLTPADLTKIGADAKRFGQVMTLPGEVAGPFPSDDKRAAQTIVPLDLGDDDNDSTAADVINKLRDVAEADSAGMTVHITGPGGNAADLTDAFSGIDSTLLLATIGIVVVLLLLIYRSPMLWLFPVLSAGAALTTAQAVIYLLAKHAGLTVNFQSSGILTVLVFGAGTDYALLLVARYREELHRHEDRHAAMAEALHRSGPAIVASAATVAAAMLFMLFAETNSTKGLGPVAAVGVIVALFVMVTLLPALLVTVGRWVFWPVRPTYDPSSGVTAHRIWDRIGSAIARRPRVTALLTTLLLALLALPLVGLDAGGLSNAQSYRTKPDSIIGEEVLAKHFPAGSGVPLIVSSRPDQAEQVRTAVAGTPGIESKSVTPPEAQGEYSYLQATLTDAADSEAAFRTVERVREAVHNVPGAQALVGGTTAVNLDLQKAAEHDRALIIPLVLGVVFIILMLLLRAIVAPLFLMATVVLSFASALGISTLIFRAVLGHNHADTSFPLYVFVFLVALGIDYNIFLMTRVREEAERHGTRRGTLIALSATGGVITSAGLVLAGTFAVLLTLPVTNFFQMGFAVALGVLLDTLVVRSVLVVALNLDVGRHMWWPSRLARRTDDEPPAAEAAPREVSPAEA
ncbi:MMPL family transporter [Couchioplanes caeruleus]|uniref:MMPL family transporter n=1 Tax=Couchioplanes caeruleus TaxID=56438 RepID=UPI00201BCD1E|nr:MMPL family transporter [Couchioplanes caeruleus]UQU67696.1 MMPL family transporter [Couchioplanes caeruleus]